MKHNMLISVFPDHASANDAVEELQEMGYDPKRISLLMKNSTDDTETVGNDKATNVTQGAISGATTGGLLAGLAGLLVGVGAIAIPGIGALFIGGPLAAALGLTGAAATAVSAAATGVVAGGLVGALTGLGIPEEKARVYEERVKSGGVVVAVPTDIDDMDIDETTDILNSHGAQDVVQV